MKLILVFLLFLLFALTLAVEVSRVGSDLNESQSSSENETIAQKNSFERLWRAMKYRLGKKKQTEENQITKQQDDKIDNYQEDQVEDQVAGDIGLVEDEREIPDSLGEIIVEKNISIQANGTSEQNTTEKQLESPMLEDRPNQMAPITKALLYIRPKRDERWVMLEEGLIKWAISSYLQPYASEIFMNCNLYRDGNMILSVFRGVPLSIGTESWTPPGFLEPAPNYQLRLWSQPSRIGLIDEYSALFSIVPSADDAFMFNSNPKPLMDDTLKDTEVYKGNKDNNDDIYQPTTKTEANKYTAITPKFTPGYSAKTVLLGSNNPEPNINLANRKQYSTESKVAIAPNIPTGIYALYPSLSSKVFPTLFCIFSSASLMIYFSVL